MFRGGDGNWVEETHFRTWMNGENGLFQLFNDFAGYHPTPNVRDSGFLITGVNWV